MSTINKKNRFKKYQLKLEETTIIRNDRDFPVLGHFLVFFFGIFSFAKPGHRGRLLFEIRAFIREANHNKMSADGFERHTPVLELGLRGATHALRVLSSK